VVLLGGTADRFDFVADDDAKSAFLSGNFTGPTTLPASPRTFDGYPVITARQGLARLRGDNPPRGPGRHRPVLRITGMRLAEARVSTDRGQKTLPVWRFTMTHVRGHVSVPASAAPVAWPLPAGAAPADTSRPAGFDGQDVTVRFIGGAAGTGPCTSDYRVEAVESAQAVVYHEIEVPHSIPSGSTANGRPAVGYFRQARLHLSTPLGKRVLLDVNFRGVIEGPIPVDSGGR
jgi:hypothetical protein